MTFVSPSTPSLQARPLPYLPLEVKGHILRFCDPPTLFSTSLVFLAFLELSSPILYEDVIITGIKRLADLLCVEIEHPQPQLERHLSLSLIRNLTYYHLKVGTSSSTTSQEHLSRLQKPSKLLRHLPLPLNLDKLHLLVDDGTEWDSRPGLTGERVGALLSYLSPKSFVFEGVLQDGAEEDVDLPLVSLIDVDHWTRLEDIAFTTGMTTHTFGRSAFLLAPETNPPINLLYDLSRFGNDDWSTPWFINVLEDLRGGYWGIEDPLESEDAMKMSRRRRSWWERRRGGRSCWKDWRDRASSRGRPSSYELEFKVLVA